MNILIYTYGNHQMGMGHIYRMLNLGVELKKRGHKVSVLIPSWKEGINKFTENGFELIKIPTTYFEDIVRYKQQLNTCFYDCIIVDALNVDKSIMKIFREKTNILLSLDNVGEGRFFSDILINLLYRCEPKLKKPKLEINSFDYLILNKDFEKFNSTNKCINKTVKRILITQGGSDTYGILPKIINILNNADEIEYNILIGSAFKHYKDLNSSLKRKNLKFKIIKNIKNPAELFYNMDLAISGGGMTLFELLCVGTPCITLTQETKEIETINYLDKLGLVDNLGLYKDIQEIKITPIINNLVINYRRRLNMSVEGKKLVDGRGCKRIVSLIETFPKNKIL